MKARIAHIEKLVFTYFCEKYFWVTLYIIVRMHNTHHSSEGNGHRNSEERADNPDDDDNHFGPILAGVAFQRKHNSTKSKIIFFYLLYQVSKDKGSILLLYFKKIFGRT